MQKLYKFSTERSQLADRFKPRILLLWGDSVNHYTTVLHINIKLGFEFDSEFVRAVLLQKINSYFQIRESDNAVVQ